VPALPGRNDPYNPNVQRPVRISASPDILMSCLPGTQGGTDPPAILQDRLSQTKTCGESPNNNFATSPHSTPSHKAAHLGPGLDVPDLDEVVGRAGDEVLPIRGEIDRQHGARVTRQRVHLPPTNHYQGKTRGVTRHRAPRVPGKFLMPLLVFL